MTQRTLNGLSARVKHFFDDFLDPTEVTHSQEVGQRIAQARRELGVRDQRDVLRGEVAEAVGVDPSTITAWEQGRKTPREEALRRLAAFLGVTPAFLRYGISGGETAIPAPRRLTDEEIEAARARVAARRGAGGTPTPPPTKPVPKDPPLRAVGGVKGGKRRRPGPR